MGSGNLRLVWDGTGPIPADFDTACSMEQPERVVAKTVVGDAEVSTVFLCLDHAHFGASRPMLYETLIFGGRHDGDMQRYATRAEAEAGHAIVVARLGGAQ